MDTRDTSHRSLDDRRAFEAVEVADRREPPLLYPVADVAALLGISRSNVYQLLRAGRLTSVCIGARRSSRRTSLQSFVEGLVA